MSDSYYEGTGELTLRDVTPVIRALFGAFSVQKQADGTAYIRNLSTADSTRWSSIATHIVAVIGDKLKLSAPDAGDAVDADGFDVQQDASDVVGALLEIFNVTDPALMNLVEHIADDADAELDDLLAIALACDDEHGLTSIRFEGCWYSDKPRLFEFGGHGVYHSSSVSVWADSNEAFNLGSALDNAFKSNDIEAGVNTLKKKMRAIVNGIKDDEQRNAVMVALNID